jgi:hypothetical protein
MAKNQSMNIEHGAAEHAALLGLRKATQEDAIQLDGWTLVDMTIFGPQVTDAYLREVLRQKVSELKHKPKPTDEPIWQPA